MTCSVILRIFLYTFKSEGGCHRVHWKAIRGSWHKKGRAHFEWCFWQDLVWSWELTLRRSLVAVRPVSKRTISKGEWLIGRLNSREQLKNLERKTFSGKLDQMRENLSGGYWLQMARGVYIVVHSQDSSCVWKLVRCSRGRGGAWEDSWKDSGRGVLGFGRWDELDFCKVLGFSQPWWLWGFQGEASACILASACIPDS